MIVGQIYTVKIKSGNTGTVFDWAMFQGEQAIPKNGNKFMKNKCVKVTKALKPKGKLDWDYVVDIYDMVDDVLVMKNIKIVGNQLTALKSTYKPPKTKSGSRKTKRTSKKKKSRKKRKSKRNNKKTKTKKTKKTKKRLRGGTLARTKSVDLLPTFGEVWNPPPKQHGVRQVAEPRSTWSAEQYLKKFTGWDDPIPGAGIG